MVPTQCSLLPTPWAGDIRWSCWKLRSEDKETLGYLQQASLLRTHCVAAVKSLKAMIYFSSGFLKSCQCAAAFAPILIKLTYLWFSNDPEDISYVMWNAKMRINLKRAFRNHVSHLKKLKMTVIFLKGFKYTKMLKNQRICGSWRIFWRQQTV